MTAPSANAPAVQFGDLRLPPRFWRKCVPEPNSGCWLWLAAIDGAGYPSAWNGSAVTSGHRLSYATFNGDIPEGLLVRHRCDTPICVNPAHLLVGTDADNMLDVSLRFRRFTAVPAPVRDAMLKALSVAPRRLAELRAAVGGGHSVAVKLTDLRRLGLVANVRGVWSITDKGREQLARAERAA